MNAVLTGAVYSDSEHRGDMVLISLEADCERVTFWFLQNAY